MQLVRRDLLGLVIMTQMALVSFLDLSPHRPNVIMTPGSARQNEPRAVHGVARHHDEGPAAHAHHEGQPAVRPHLLLLIMKGKVNIITPR